VSPFFGRVVINEVLIDGTAEGDLNGDGDTGHPFEDQFVKLVNVHDAAGSGGAAFSPDTRLDGTLF